MKALYFSIFLLLLMVAGIANAQAPGKFNYQAVARDGSGSFLPNQAVRLQVSIRQGSVSGSIVYTESHAVTTTNIGLINVAIGTGVVSSGSFGAINWGAGPYYIEMGLDASGGTNYTILGTQQFLSVPYAMFADSSANPGPAGPMGPVGPQGAQGQAGPTGPQGAQGQTGLTGPQGAQGQTGPAGPQGQQGVAGPTGPAGPIGLTGPTGPQGAQGPQGIQGDPGPIGPVGPAGPMGQPGQTGAVGPQGPQGDPGPTGPVGPTGQTGPQGQQGNQGPQGSTGPQGPTGPAGSANINGTSGYVIKFTPNGTTGGNSVIWSENLGSGSQNVGIGTTNPSSSYKVVVTTGLNYGIASTGSHTGVVGIGNGLSSGLVDPNGSGIAGAGTVRGVVGYSTSTSTSVVRAGGYFQTNGSGSYAYIGCRTSSNTARKIEGNGTVNTTVKDQQDNLVVLSAPEAPENLFMDFGAGQLVNGVAHVDLDKTLSKNIVVDTMHPLRVFIQLEGDCNGVFVTNKSANGFDIRELSQGTSSTTFTWFVTANRADEVLPDGTISRYSEERFAPAIGPASSTTSTSHPQNDSPNPGKDLK